MKEYALTLAGAMVGKGVTRLVIEADVRTGRATAPSYQTFTFWWSIGAPILVGILEYFEAVKGPLEYFLMGMGSHVATNLFDYAEEVLRPSPWITSYQEAEARKAVEAIATEASPTAPRNPFREL